MITYYWLGRIVAFLEGMTIQRTLLLFSSILTFTAFSSPLDAIACGTPMPSIYSTIPSSGGVLPVNTSVVIFGVDIDVSKIIAKVDGVPTLVSQGNSPASSMGYGQSYPIKFEPALQVGQKVELSGSICSEKESGCNLALTFTVGEADLIPPGEIEEVSINIHDYNDFVSSGGDCQDDRDLAFYISIKGQKSADDPGYISVYGYNATAEKEWLFSKTGYRSSTGGGQVIVHTTKNPSWNGPLPSNICVEVVGFDLAGNKTKTFQQCGICHLREDPPNGQMQFNLPDEPEWTAADIVKGGACDPGGDLGGAGGTSTGGSGGTSNSAGQGGDKDTSAGKSTKEDDVLSTTQAPEQTSDEGCSIPAGQRGSALGGLWVAIAALGVYLRRRRLE